MSTQPSQPVPVTSGRPRRRSVFTGLLLIALGVLFLMRNFGWNYDLSRFVRWWPVLLIIWGLAKLYDHIVAQRIGQSPPRTVTGGEILLLILVLLLLGGVATSDWFHRHPGEVGNWGWDNEGWAPWEHTYTYNVDIPARTIPAKSLINIQTDRGDITVHPEDVSAISVSARKTVGGTSDDEAQKRGQQISVAIEQTGNGYDVHPQISGTESGQARVDLEVHVPKQASLTARSGRGNVQVNGLAGSVTAETQNGDVDVRDTGGDVSVDLTKGDVHIIGVEGNVKLSGRGDQITIANVKGEAVIEGEFFGPITVEKAAKGARFLSHKSDVTISALAGRLTLGSGRIELMDAPGNVNLVTTNNDVSLENVTGRIHIEDRNGNVELRFAQAPREQIEVINSNANIELVLPANSTFEIHGSATHSGEAYSDFNGVQQNRDPSGSVTLEGKVGAQGPVINLRTTYGAVRLRKGQ